MNNKLIEKVIQTNLGVCPEIFYKNPVLDRNVAKALAKSFVKILTLSELNSAVHNNLRISILENIRKMCVVEPEDHMSIDESLSEALSDIYIKQAQGSSKNSTDKDLDAFLIKRFKTMNINPQHESTVNPEIIQALLNLNENGVYLEVLARDVVHWNANKGNYLTIIKSLWDNELMDNKSAENMYDNLSIKMKPEIEKVILNVCQSILKNQEVDLDNMFSDPSLLQIIKKCAISAECFQVCIGALNFVFIMTNFDTRLQKFIPAFVKKVQVECPKITFSVLYPVHINYIVVMLDFEVNILPEELKVHYVTPTLKHMQKLRATSEHDFIMLLSHFPQWFDIYFHDTEDIPPRF